jgi:hypothetical protein
MQRVWHRYEIWEDYCYGMYSSLSQNEKEQMKKDALSLMKDTEAFYLSMLRAVYEWPISSEHNLTAIGSNRRSWVGQAALAIQIGCPEDLTRQCWSEITNRERRLANRAADKVIQQWEKQYATKSLQLHIYMGKSWLQARNTRRSRSKDRSYGARTVVSSNMQSHINERFSADIIGF